MTPDNQDPAALVARARELMLLDDERCALYCPNIDRNVRPEIEALAAALERAEAEAVKLREQLRPGSPTERAPTLDAYNAACAALWKHRDENERLRAEMRRMLPIIERAENDPALWVLLTEGTGVATANGYRAALSPQEPTP